MPGKNASCTRNGMPYRWNDSQEEDAGGGKIIAEVYGGQEKCIELD